MYMSYVLDYKEATMETNDDNTYILATDADVRFTHESVQALLDLMMRDEQVGAVCGRTHPLGTGPVVWYQVFDYAIGHWFQKVWGGDGFICYPLSSVLPLICLFTDVPPHDSLSVIYVSYQLSHHTASHLFSRDFPLTGR